MTLMPVADVTTEAKCGRRTLAKLEAAGWVATSENPAGRDARGLFRRASVDAVIAVYERRGISFSVNSEGCPCLCLRTVEKENK